MFRGSYVLNLDAKGRLAIPTRYREQLAAACNGCMVLTFNPRDHCLFLYPLPAWDALEKKLVALPDFDEQASLVKRVMQGTAMECEMDGQGRILVPELHKEHANLDKRVACCGLGERFELWDELAWKEQVVRCQELYKATPSDAVKNLVL